MGNSEMQKNLHHLVLMANDTWSGNLAGATVKYLYEHLQKVEHRVEGMVWQ